MAKADWLRGPRIDPKPINGDMHVVDLIDSSFIAYNGGRLREACQLFAQSMLDDDVTVGMSLSGALTPAGLGIAALVPLIEHGFVDWIVSTGANLYHDAHYGLDLYMHQGTPEVDDAALRAEGVVRIYDILLDYDILVQTDNFLRQMMRSAQFQRRMPTSEFHYLVGAYLWERERKLGLRHRCLLSVAHEYGVPIYTPAPGDSSIGLNAAAMVFEGNRLDIDVQRDVNETAGIVFDAKTSGGKSAVLILGGGTAKNFVLQTEPQIQEVLGLAEKGHDYFVQITDARPDTGGLSGATPAEAVSWGKVDPAMLRHTVVCYTDTTIALPLLTCYALSTHVPRRPKRLYERRDEVVEKIGREFDRVRRERQARGEPY